MSSSPTEAAPVRRRVWWFVSEHARIVGWVFGYIVARRAWFIAPLVMMLLALGLFIFASVNPAVSPFLYALF
jgi:hypothetical protein